MRRVVASGTLALCLLGLVSCVTGAEVRPTRAEAAQGPPPEPGEPTAARMLADVPGSTTPAQEPARKQDAGSGSVWVFGYWHWTGVRYEWVPGRWEAQSPVYLH